MSKRYSVVQAKEVPGRDKPVWLRHGIAFEGDKGISIKLESLPLPNEKGEVWLRLFVDDGKGSQRGSQQGSQVGGPSDDLNDEIPW